MHLKGTTLGKTLNNTRLGLLVAVVIFFTFALLFAETAYAANGGVDIGCAVKLGGQCISAAFPTLGDFFSAIVRLGLFAAALVFFAMVVWGGFRYLNAGGDRENVEGARKTLTGAGVGLVIIVVALAISPVIFDTLGVGTSGQIKKAQKQIKNMKEASKDASQVLGISASRPYTTPKYKIEYRPKSSTFVVTIPAASSIEEWRQIKKDSEKVFKDIDLCSIYLFWSVPHSVKPQLQRGETRPTGC